MIRSTTVLSVRHKGQAVMAGDGQVTFGDTVVKQSARKIRRLYNDKILAGFAGSAADSFALFSRFESKLEQYRGNLERSAVELAKDWRTDRSFFTVGEDEVRAWTIRRGTVARAAAGQIHSDLERGFIRAEVTPYARLMEYGSEQAVKDAGLLQIEGKDYEITDGEIMHVRFNV